MRLTVNRKTMIVKAHPLTRLLDVLREECGLTGTKEGCGEGECGACTVLVDGEAVNSCLVLAVESEGRAVGTIEGVEGPKGLDRVQRSFLENAALQCGICTPGYIVAARALLAKKPNPTEHEVRHWCAGNLCRRTGYDKIGRAILQAARTAEGGAA